MSFSISVPITLKVHSSSQILSITSWRDRFKNDSCFRCLFSFPLHTICFHMVFPVFFIIHLPGYVLASVDLGRFPEATGKHNYPWLLLGWERTKKFLCCRLYWQIRGKCPRKTVACTLQQVFMKSQESVSTLVSLDLLVKKNNVKTWILPQALQPECQGTQYLSVCVSSENVMWCPQFLLVLNLNYLVLMNSRFSYCLCMYYSNGSYFIIHSLSYCKKK